MFQTILYWRNFPVMRPAKSFRFPDIPAFGRSWSMTHGAEERMLWSDSFPIAILCSGYVRIPIVALLNDERISTSGKSGAVFMCKECVTALAGIQIGALESPLRLSAGA